MGQLTLRRVAVAGVHGRERCLVLFLGATSELMHDSIRRRLPQRLQSPMPSAAELSGFIRCDHVARGDSADRLEARAVAPAPLPEVTRNAFRCPADQERAITASQLQECAARRPMDERTVIEARRLAQAACAAAESPVRSQEAYVRLRAQARALNERERWVSDDEFDAQFPAASALQAIDELERQYRKSVV